jgi:mycothiol synthase
VSQVVGVGSWGHGSVDTTAITQLVDRAAAVDGVAALSGHVLDALAAGSADLLTLIGDAGLPIGVAAALGGDPAEVLVDPASRRRGHGTALATAALDRQGALWAYGDLPAARALAAGLGLTRGRVLLQMRRSPGGSGASLAEPASTDHASPDPALPAGVRIRTFVPGQDEEAFLAVNARAFAWHPEQGRLDLAGLRAEMAQDWFDPAGFFLAVRRADSAQSETVVGFHWTKIHQVDPSPGSAAARGPIGEIYVLGVDPESGIRGLGGPLTTAGLDYLATRGLDTVMLYVEGDNDRAILLYERFGFRPSVTNAVYSRPAADTR